MSVSGVNYIVYGFAEKNKTRVKAFFKATEEDWEASEPLIEQFCDNGYQNNISKSKTGIYVIEDGMGGSYIVVGRILYKNTDGFEFLRESELKDKYGKQEVDTLYKVAKQLDEKFGSKFSLMKPELLIFTHWH